MKLYYAPQTRAHRPRWMLEELGVPYELIRLDPSKRENRTPEYLALNPTGHVPTFVEDDGTAFFESAAICLYLADKYIDKGFAPPHGSSTLRGPYLQWIVYAMSELEPSISTFSAHTRTLPEEKRLPQLADAAKAKFDEHAAILTAALGEKQFLVGDRFSAADVMIGGVLGWGKMLGLVNAHERVLAYIKHLQERASFRAARV
jgi:glutathione S-transferase